MITKSMLMSQNWKTLLTFVYQNKMNFRSYFLENKWILSSASLPKAGKIRESKTPDPHCPYIQSAELVRLPVSANSLLLLFLRVYSDIASETLLEEHLSLWWCVIVSSEFISFCQCTAQTVGNKLDGKLAYIMR